MRTITLRMDIVPHIDIWIWFSIVRSIHLTLPRSIVRDHLLHIMPFVERLGVLNKLVVRFVRYVSAAKTIQSLRNIFNNYLKES